MYTDPGSGLFFIQVAITVGLTIAYRLRHMIARFFTGKNDSDPVTK